MSEMINSDQSIRLVFADPVIDGELKVDIVNASGVVQIPNASFVDRTAYTVEPTPHSAAVMNHLAQGVWEAYARMGGSAGQTKQTKFLPGGSIFESISDTASGIEVASKTTAFNANGSITQTFSAGGYSVTKTTQMNPDGSITEVVE